MFRPLTTREALLRSKAMTWKGSERGIDLGETEMAWTIGTGSYDHHVDQ